MAYDRAGSYVKAAEIRARAEKRSRQPQVQLNKNLLHTFVKRKMKKVKESKHMIQIKQEQCDQAFEKFKSDKLDAATIYKKIDQMEKDESPPNYSARSLFCMQNRFFISTLGCNKN